MRAVSSPRVRETEVFVEVGADVDRAIPACAGNRMSRAVRAAPVRCHPRVCGEQRIQDFDSPFAMVSSQRVRGTDGDETVEVHVPRVIPACAGNTSRDIAWSWFRTGHPCVCGEQYYMATNVAMENGSSLRVRGAAVDLRHGWSRLRVIPACAGNSGRTTFSSRS